jgi:hypothetical protein
MNPGHPLMYAFRPPNSFDIPNFQNSFLDQLSSLMQEQSQGGEERGVEELQDNEDSYSHNVVQLVEEEDNEQNNQEQDSSASEQSDSDQQSEQNQSSDEVSSSSGSEQPDAEAEALQLLLQLQSSKKAGKQKPAKVVPLVSKKKSVQFYQELKQEPEPESEEDENVREIDIQGEEQQELVGLIRQLVRLESEETKAQQFLEYIQKYSCFDKQDQAHTRFFLEQIQNEKKMLTVVLNNYGPNMQPLITMMTIAERRITLLDQSHLITPESTLHNSFLDKQKQLQAIIDEACDHIYRRK